MGLRQFATSLRRIAGNRHVHRPTALARHLLWQGRKLLRSFPFEQRFSHSRIIAEGATCGVSALIFSQGLYDYNNMNLLRAVVTGRRFMDVGANVGAYTLLASEDRSARVYAFEPHPRTFAALTQNVHLNARDNVELCEVALSDRAGETRFTDSPRSSLNQFARDGAIVVRTERADTWCQQHGVVPDIVKIDVEGFEHEVLAGFGALRREVGLFLIEVNGLSDARGRGGSAIEALLAESGHRGPLVCDFDERRLVAVRGDIGEDSLFVSQTFARGLRELGFQVDA